MKRRGSRLFRYGLLGTSLFFLMACGNSDLNRSSPRVDSSQCRVVKHDLDQVEVCGQPETIVVLSSHMLDLLLALGEQPDALAGPIGLVKEDVFQNPAQQIPYLGAQVTTQPVNLGNAQAPSMEKITALNPDLILAEAGRNADSYQLFSKIAPTLLWKDRTAKGKWQTTLKGLAKALGKEEQTQQVIAAHNQEIDQAKQQLTPIAAQYPKVLILGSSDLNSNIGIIPPDSFLGDLFEQLGFRVMTLPDTKGPFVNVPISIEALPQLDEADIIIVLGYNLDAKERPKFKQGSIDEVIEVHQSQSIRESWAENAIAQSLTASKEGRVYFATYYKWNGLNGPTGTKLILEQLRDFLLTSANNPSP